MSKINSATIVAQPNEQKQYLERLSQKSPPLTDWIRQHRLTDCLEWLETHTGLISESALFILSWIGGGR